MSEQPLISFQNTQLNLDELPQIEDIQYQALAPAYWKYSMVLTTVLFLMIGGAALTGTWVGAERWIAILLTGIWLLLLIFSLALVGHRYRIKGYALRSHDLVYRQGLFFRKVITIPFSRLQHCEIQEGPLERLFGLNTLAVFTAGGSSSDVTIPGLLPPEAKRLRDFILGVVVAEEEAKEEES